MRLARSLLSGLRGWPHGDAALWTTLLRNIVMNKATGSHIQIVEGLARCVLVTMLMVLGTPLAHAGVGPLIGTTWGQGGFYQNATPTRDGEPTYPGCTTIAASQILYYFQYQNHANEEVSYWLDNDGLVHPDLDGRSLYLDLPRQRYDYDAMAASLDGATQSQIDATATFIYHVAVSLNAQFGNGEGSSATGKQIENAFRYNWGFNNISRRNMSVISKSAFGFSDAEWADVIRTELDAGRPVLHMAQKTDANVGHAFVIDGYDDAGKFHVNWGWGGWANGYYDVNVLEDPSGRRWSRDAMIFRGLEPEAGFGLTLRAGTNQPAQPEQSVYSWNGTGSLISYTSGTKRGYGLTKDEAQIHATSENKPVVFFQWEVDQRDGERIEISAPGVSTASITYGPWYSREGDRTFENVTLPFVIDPSRDGFAMGDQEYFVFAVAFAEKPSDSLTVSARATSNAASSGSSVAARALNIDGRTWNGNGSIIGLTSGTATGYGLTQDETQIHPESENLPVVFFQWEIDSRDGNKLEISADGMGSATISYGSWDNRTADVTRTVSLPYVLDPAADGLSSANGSYLVIEVAFDHKPSSDVTVAAKAVD